MTHRLAVTSCIAVFAAASGRTSAQTPDPRAASPTAQRFATEIVVTPERGEAPRAGVPGATAVIDRQTLAALPVLHPSELISFLPGFDMARPDFHAGRPIVSSRGFFGGGEAEYVLLLVDGMPVADVESGLIDWSAVPTSSIRRVEAYRGPAASLYGDAAVGGVIQILTERPANGGQFTTSAGSYRSFTADGLFGHRLPGVGFTLSGAARRTDGGFDHSAGHQLAGAGSMDGVFRAFSWRWNAAADTRDRDDPGALSENALHVAPYTSDPMFRFDTVSRHSLSTAFALRHTAAWKPQGRVYATTRDEDLIRTIPIAPDLGDRQARALSSVAVGGSLEGEHAFVAAQPWIIRFGADVAREHLDTSYRSVNAVGAIGSLSSQAVGHRVRAGLFTFTSWEPTVRVRLTGGLRWDEVDDTGFGSATGPAPQRAWSPRAGASWRLTDAGSVTLFAQTSRAFKTPTLDQLFDPRQYPNFRGGTFSISNRGLVPQRASDVEAGVSGGGAVRWSALAYRMTVDNELDFDLRTFSYANIGRGRHTGVELEADARWWKRVRPSLTYVRSRVVDLPGDRQLKNVPRHLLTAGASVDFPWAIALFARYHRAWGAFLDDANRYPIEGPSRVDVRISRPLGRQSLFVDMLNATKAVYEEYGFTLTDFRGRVVPYAYPGAPRAVRAGVTVSF